MERMITERVAYCVESRGPPSPHKRGSGTMDTIICLETGESKKGSLKTWIKDFLFNRQVREGIDFSEGYAKEKCTPQGTVIRPVLFSL